MNKWAPYYFSTSAKIHFKRRYIFVLFFVSVLFPRFRFRTISAHAKRQTYLYIGLYDVRSCEIALHTQTIMNCCFYEFRADARERERELNIKHERKKCNAHAQWLLDGKKIAQRIRSHGQVFYFCKYFSCAFWKYIFFSRLWLRVARLVFIIFCYFQCLKKIKYWWGVVWEIKRVDRVSRVNGKQKGVAKVYCWVFFISFHAVAARQIRSLSILLLQISWNDDIIQCILCLWCWKKNKKKKIELRYTDPSFCSVKKCLFMYE